MGVSISIPASEARMPVTLQSFTLARMPAPKLTSALGQSVTKTIPSYLRIHRDVERPSDSNSQPNPTDSLTKFWNAYTDATGWRIDSRATRLQSKMELLPTVSHEAAESEGGALDLGISKIAAARLAESAAEIAKELCQTRDAIKRQQAELASHATSIGSQFDAASIACQIENALCNAVGGSECQAAAMYVLDDETQYLNTRAVYGLPSQRLAEASRELRGSRGDLEALVGDVIAIENASAGPIDTWNCPEDFDSALCVALKVDDVPIGTMWLFRDHVGEFTEAQKAVARLAASQLTLLLRRPEAEHLVQGKSESPIQDIATWQFESLPVGSSLADGWCVDGMIESGQPWATGWHHWDVLPDGTMMLAIAEAVDKSAKGAMHAAIARAAVAAHTGYRHTPKQLMQRVGDTLWQTSTGEQLVSLLYAIVDPETGDGEFASAGTIESIISSRYGYRPLADGKTEPLNTHIDARCVSDAFRLQTGETVLAYTDGFGFQGITQSSLGNHLRSAMEAQDKSPLAFIRRQLAETPVVQERGALTLYRV